MTIARRTWLAHASLLVLMGLFGACRGQAVTTAEAETTAGVIAPLANQVGGSAGLPAVAAQAGPAGADSTEQPQAGSETGSLSASDAEARRRIEAHILASTVQLVIQNWLVVENDAGYIIDQSIGHATVLSDSRLITHNHFSIPLTIRQRDEETAAYAVVTLYDTSGRRLLQAPLSAFELAWEDKETMVFAYKDERQFDALGLPPTRLGEWTSLPLRSGSVVAQVDWDGATTRVDWTTIQEVKLDDGVPTFVLADGVTLGASGGGIFWNGLHIANNWRLRQILDASGRIVESQTIVALNSTEALCVAEHC